MTNTQLLLSIGIPSILIILAWLSNNTRLSGLDTRLSGVESRLDTRLSGVETRLDSRMSGLEARLDSRISGLEARLDSRINDLAAAQEAMSQAHHRDFVELLRAMTTLHERVAKVEERQK